MRVVSNHDSQPAISGDGLHTELLEGVLAVLSSSVDDMIGVLSRVLRPLIPHCALVVLTDDTGAPSRGAGPEGLIDCVALRDLTALRDQVAPLSCAPGTLALDGVRHDVWTARADDGAVLVVIDPVLPAAGPETALAIWRVAAQLLQRAAREATPRFLHQSRTAAAIRAQVIDELNDLHLTALESLLAVLRSHKLDDRAARQTATRLAADSVIGLRTSTDRLRTFNEEPVTSAFQRLREDLRPLVRYRELDVQFIEPPINGRALPSEIAHGARAVVRGAVLTLADQSGVQRVRVQWDCDGTNLLINLRDDGPGELSLDSAMLQPLQQRITAMHGRISLETTPGWGSELAMVVPLDPLQAPGSGVGLPRLSAREAEVLALMTQGWRNQLIADRLGISINTVKYHVSNILDHLGAASRTEAIAIALGSTAATQSAAPLHAIHP